MKRGHFHYIKKVSICGRNERGRGAATEEQGDVMTFGGEVEDEEEEDRDEGGC